MFAKILLIINLLLILIIIVCERKNLRSIIFWCIIVLLFSFIGYLLYIVFGNRLKFKAKKELKNKQLSTKNYLKKTKWYKTYTKNKRLNLNINSEKIALYFKRKLSINIWHNNYVSIYNSSEQFLQSLLKDLQNAKSTINMQFYIFSDDKTGKTIAEILKQKAKQGVVVNLLYDAIGSKNTHNAFFKNLKNSGVNVYPFFPGKIFNFFNLKINYRNHKKIIVIDGCISYVGGINIRNDHMGLDKKLFPWRDTMVRIYGNCSYALNNIFLNDWCYVSNKKISKFMIDLYFPQITVKSKTITQVLDGGADKRLNQIEELYLKLIKTAKNYLYIQSPYFIVNNNIINQIIKAKKRGVDVKIIIPKKPDKKIVYAGTLKCIKQLVGNASIYFYNGFIHSKVVLNDYVLSVGSANFDNRSLYLNFEANVLIYNQNHIKKYKQQFIFDTQNSLQLTQSIFNKKYKSNIFFNIIYNILKHIL